jgi:hypothetical protein
MANFAKRSLHSIAILLPLIISTMALPFVYGQNQSANQNTSDNNAGLTIDSIQCDMVEHFNFHIHSGLEIKIDDRPIAIPGGIGIIPEKCIYWLHTHDDTGTIHIESPIEQTFTLGQFLNIWKAFDNSSLNQVITNNILNDTNLDANGKQIDGITDYKDMELKDNATISINFSRLS